MTCWFESPPPEPRMNHGFLQKLLTFLRQYGNEGCRQIS